MRQFFVRFDEKHKLLGNFEKISKFLMKIQWKNWILTIIGKVVSKNRAFENNIIFLQQLFPLRGSITPVAPWLRHWLQWLSKTLFEPSFHSSKYFYDLAQNILRINSPFNYPRKKVSRRTSSLEIVCLEINFLSSKCEP